MSHTSSHVGDSLLTFDRRRDTRHRVKSLSYLDLGRDNGGILLNISEGGLAVQAVGVFAENPILTMHFQLPESKERLEATGQIVWTSESKREAGIQFTDLSDQVREQIKGWVSKQAPSSFPESERGSVREIRREVLGMPSMRGSKRPATDPAVICGLTDEEFNAMFPSEKTPPPPREFKPPATNSEVITASSPAPDAAALPEEQPEATQPKADIPIIDAALASEPTAISAQESTPELMSSSQVAEPAPPATTSLDSIAEEERPVAIPREDTAPAQPMLITSTKFSRLMPQIQPSSADSPPIAAKDEAVLEASADSPLSESTPATPTSDEIAPPFHAETAALRPMELVAPVEPLITTLPKPVEAIPPPQSPDGGAPTRAESKPLTEPPAPLLESDAHAGKESVPDLHSFAEPAAPVRRLLASDALLIKESAALPQSPAAANIHPVAEAPVAAAQPTAHSDAASHPMAQSEKPASIEPPVKPRVTSILSGTQNPTQTGKLFGELHKENTVVPKIARMPVGVNWRTASIFSFFILILAIGTAFERGAFDGLRGSTNSSAISPAGSATRSAPDHAASVPAAEKTSSAAQRENVPSLAPDTSGVASSLERPRRQAPPNTASASPRKKTIVGILSAPITPDRRVQSEATAEQSPPVIQAPSERSAGNPSPPAVFGSWNSTPKPGLPAPTPSIPEQGDRVVSSSLLYRVEPLYPPEAEQKHIEGTVKLRAVIGRDGKVMGLGLLSGPQLLVPAAMKAAREWRFIPALLNGEPVESQTEITIEFHLPGGADR
jgi:TonB family protein